MRILIIRNASDVMQYSSGNYNLQEIGLARALNKRGYHCDVAYAGGKEESTVKIVLKDGKAFSLFYLKSIDILGNGYLLKLDRLIKNYDIIQSGAYDQLRSWIMAKKYKSKIVIYQGPYFSQFNKRYNFKCRIVDFLFVPRYRQLNTSFLTKSVLAKQFLNSKHLNNVTAVGVGFDKEQMEADIVEKSQFYQVLAEVKEKGNSLLLYIGKLEERRNIEFLLSVVGECCKNNERVKLVIIGSGTEQYLAKCKSVIDKYKMSERIIYKNKLEQKYLPQIYKLCDAFLLPTKFEIFGMVILEAMYYGLPIITTFNGGPSILIVNGVDGFIQDENVELWKKKIEWILQNPKQAKEIGKRASIKIAEHFTWDAIAEKFIEVYKRKMYEH